ncbi:MAG TPA: ABC transporter ATP-binding protein [Bacteroidales bacterium]|nr:ABC transporter ATP-binding protein [Bacteroidales bacterium]HRZ77156.1 ABC transporter ATP-binding protein [Bacteroidales bacterium]
MKTAVRVWELEKRYGSTLALDGLDFSIGSGELFGFIGPDGAGKTSLFRILTTLLLPDRGGAAVLGMDVVRDLREVRKVIGYMPGRFSLYQDLSVKENLSFFATVFGTTVAENYELVRDIYGQIEPYRDRLAGKLSGGMKQKLALSCALIHRPGILILDEPTTGVDAVSRREFWDMLQRLRDEGLTILVSTPYMDEASRCDRVALMQSGRILGMDSPAAIAASFPKPLYKLRAGDMYRLYGALREFPATASVYRFGQDLHLTAGQGMIPDQDLLPYLQAQGLDDVVVAPCTPGIEDCFMELLSENQNQHDARR